jgi:antitoxin component YwqK of YwqJK toxin-antitoxin module
MIFSSSIDFSFLSNFIFFLVHYPKINLSLKCATKLINVNMWKSKQLVLLICFLTFGIVGWSYNGNNDQDGINKSDSKGKQGKWIYYGKDRPEAGIPAEGKVEEGKYVDDRKEGIWIKYHNDGVTPKLKGEYENNRPKGNYTKYHQNGKIKEIGNFEKNQYHDSLKRFHENGQLEYEADYNEGGKEQGKVKYYYPNGQLEFEYSSNNGTPTGKAVRYYENGDVKEIIEYAADGSVSKSTEKEMVNQPVTVRDPGASNERAPSIGSSPKTKGVKWQPNGYNKIYNEDDEIWQDGVFKDGKLWDGKVYVYDRDGILLKVKVYKSGVYHSDGQL